MTDTTIIVVTSRTNREHVDAGNGRVACRPRNPYPMVAESWRQTTATDALKSWWLCQACARKLRKVDAR